ncbi:MAG: AraC family transcriptional regulator [Pseudomonadota bacterium]
MVNDPIADIVRSIDLSGAVFLQAEFTAPWAITAHVTEEDCRPYMPIPRQVIAYHVVIEGELLVFAPDNSGVERSHSASAGDIIIFPHNHVHTLASAPGLKTVCGDDLILPTMQNGLTQIRYGGGGVQTKILCGFMASNAGSTPLLDVLPDVLIVSVDSFEVRNWMEASVIMAAKQLTSGSLLSASMISGLCQLLLAEALRLNLAVAAPQNGWLNGMAHPRIATALSRIHRSLGKPPSVTELARETGMSRSAFVDRFTEVLGISPRQYMLEERMKLAAALLRDGKLTSAEIALRVGYDAPEAFSRAFKRRYGKAPKIWRAGSSRGDSQFHAA